LSNGLGQSHSGYAGFAHCQNGMTGLMPSLLTSLGHCAGKLKGPFFFFGKKLIWAYIIRFEQ
jgi:hypothetical protein